MIFESRGSSLSSVCDNKREGQLVDRHKGNKIKGIVDLPTRINNQN